MIGGAEKKLTKKMIKRLKKEGNTKSYFDKDGQKITSMEYHFGNNKPEDQEMNHGKFLEEQKQKLETTDKTDKEVAKRKQKDEKMKKKLKLRKEMGYDVDEIRAPKEESSSSVYVSEAEEEVI